MLRSSGTILALVLLAACKRNASPPVLDAAAPTSNLAQADAGSTDRTLRPVGEARTQLFRAYVLDGGRLVFVGHSLVWEAQEDGSITLACGGADAFASLLPDEESLVGRGTFGRHPQMVAAAADGGVQLFFGTGTPRSYVLAGGKATPADGRANLRTAAWKGRQITFDRWEPEADKKLVWADGAAGPLPKVPSDVRLEDFLVDADGALVAFGKANGVAPLALVWTAEDADPVERKFPPPTLACRVVPSFDRRLYVSCGGLGDRRIFMLGKKGWERAFPDAGETGFTASVANDGTLYDEDPQTIVSAVVRRCPKEGACTPIADLAATKTSEGASYEPVYTESSGRNWLTFEVAQRKVATAKTIKAIFARSPGDLWVVTSADADNYVIHHSGPERARTIVPGREDERVLLRNGKPPTKWVGHCDQIFVRLGRDADSVQKRLADIKAVLDGDGYGWDLVEGRLEDKPVVGVVLRRANEKASEATMARAATKLMDRLASTPADRPDAFCTLPVLTRKLTGG